MKYMGLLEKILLIFNIIESSWIYMVFVGIVFLTLFLTLKKTISRKSCFIINLLTIIILTIYTIYKNLDVLTKVFDNLMNNIFTNIYFPSIYVYLFVLITINIISLISILKVTANKIYKTINSICLLMTNFILVLILEIIAKNEIDLFSKVSLFSNSSLVMLLELTVNIFIVWLISNTIVYLANVIVDRRTIMVTNKELVKKPAIVAPLEVSMTNLEDEYLSSNNKFIPDNFGGNTNQISSDNYKFIPNNGNNILNNQYKFIPPIEQNRELEIINNKAFDLSSFIPTQNDLFKENSNVTISNIINNEIPLIKEDVITEKEERDTYTLNDYKIFNKMLKDIKEHNNNNSVISIDKNLEYRLITKYSTENYDMFKRMLKIYSN